jgi:spore coat protein U-like protein
MQFQKSLLTATLLAAASLTAVSANAAGTATGEFNVKLTINSVCSVDAAVGTNDISFGSVDAGTAFAGVTAASSAVDIGVTCSKNAPYFINLTPQNVTSTTGAGTMNGPGADTINYQLYSDSEATKVWGNTATLGVVGNGVTGTGAGLAPTASNKHKVYAKLTSTTDIQVGNYTDNVKVSVIY